MLTLMFCIYMVVGMILLQIAHQPSIGGELLGQKTNYVLIPITFTSLALTLSIPLTSSIAFGIYMFCLLLISHAISHYKGKNSPIF